MLEKIKKYWTEFRITIIAVALAMAYFFGIKKGKKNEKASQNEKILENMGRANKARAGLHDPSVVDKLHDKYKR